MELSNTVGSQTQYFLWVILTGAFIAFLYDLIRISRKLFCTPDIIVNIEDIIFFIASGLILFIITFLKNDSELRWHGIIGTLVGILLYATIIGNFILNVSTKVINFIAKILLKTAKIVFSPLIIIYKIFKKPLRIIIWYTNRGIKKAETIAKIKKERLKNHLKNTKNMLTKK